MIIEIIDGIKYRLNEDKLTAAVWQMTGYKGDIIIPETIVFNEATYRVTSIGYEAFKGCSSLTSITIPDSVTSIGRAAFDECSSLTSIIIPNSVTSIGMRAFSCCDSLESITIPASVTSIGYQAFYGCDSLTKVIIPASVTSIEEEAFYYCDELRTIRYGGTIAQWKEIAHSCSVISCRTRVVRCTDGNAKL